MSFYPKIYTSTRREAFFVFWHFLNQKYFILEFESYAIFKIGGDIKKSK